MPVIQPLVQKLTSVVGCSILLGGFAPAIAFALPGYANLINGFCKSQGAPRVRYTDDGCTLCHHPGTFTSEPAHRVEPVWSEFELARSSNDYSFFCPRSADAGPGITSANLSAQRSIQLPAPSQGGPLSHAQMPWMSLGYPTGHAKAQPLDPTQPLEQASTTQPRQSETPAATARTSAPSSARQASDKTKAQLDQLRDDLGLSQSQQAPWMDLQDAVLSLRAMTGTATATTSSAGTTLAERLDEQQRQHTLAIARLRAVDTALVRLNAQLNERQQRVLTARLPPLITESGSSR